ncbi:MAG: alpha/beta fold hydrolase [Bacillota bacterium]
MKKINIISFDGLEIKAYLYDNIVVPKGIVQITHGMSEHAMRYDHFAKFLNEAGYIVCTYDVRGHGATCGDPEKVGEVGIGDNFTSCVKDQGEVSCFLKDLYPNLKLIVFGHSYGSFLTQKYIQTYDFADKAIICGSGMQTGALLSAGLAIAKLGNKFKGKNAQAQIIANMSFGGYEKHFAKLGDNRKNSWLNRNIEEVEIYNQDPYCGRVFTYGFYKSFFSAFKTIYDKKALENIEKDMPILMISGSDDPVGDYTKSVEALCKLYLDCGLDVSLKLIPEMRHEILKETDKEIAYDAILNFIEK